jgi:hypothetical protein
MRTCLILCSVLLLSVIFCSSFTPLEVFRDDYKPGYYLDSSGKIEGYIKFTYDTYEKFDFKKALTDKKTTKRVNECIGFSVDGKTFRVIENINMRIGIWKIFAEKAFAEVPVEGRLSLYKVYSMLGSTRPGPPDQIANYFLEKNNSKKYIYAPPGKGKFRDEMMDFFQDRIDIAEKIDDGTYNLGNIVDIVKDYNAKPCDTCQVQK